MGSYYTRELQEEKEINLKAWFVKRQGNDIKVKGKKTKKTR